MEKQPTALDRLFMFDERSVFKPMLSGFLIGAALAFISNKDVAMAMGGGIGGALVFTVVWKIVRMARKDSSCCSVSLSVKLLWNPGSLLL